MNGSQQSERTSDQRKLTPAEVVTIVKIYVRTFVYMVFLVVLAAAVGAGGFLCLAAIWRALQEARRALGV